MSCAELNINNCTIYSLNVCFKKNKVRAMLYSKLLERIENEIADGNTNILFRIKF